MCHSCLLHLPQQTPSAQHVSNIPSGWPACGTVRLGQRTSAHGRVKIVADRQLEPINKRTHPERKRRWQPASMSTNQVTVCGGEKSHTDTRGVRLAVRLPKHPATVLIASWQSVLQPKYLIHRPRNSEEITRKGLLPRTKDAIAHRGGKLIGITFANRCEHLSRQSAARLRRIQPFCKEFVNRWQIVPSDPFAGVTVGRRQLPVSKPAGVPRTLNVASRDRCAGVFSASVSRYRFGLYSKCPAALSAVTTFLVPRNRSDVGSNALPRKGDPR